MQKLLTLLPAFFLLSCQPQVESRQPGVKTIMLKATGEIETLPDMATFRVQLSCLKKTVKQSKECLLETSNELNRKLLSFGIQQQDLLTTAVDLNKSYTWSNNSRIFQGYNSSTTLYVTVKDLQKLDVIYTELLENRDLEIGSLAYGHSGLDSLKNEAYLKALKNAEALADKLLTGLPETKKEVLKIGNVAITASEPETAVYEREERLVMADAAGQVANQSIAISKGTVKVRSELFVEFRVR